MTEASEDLRRNGFDGIADELAAFPELQADRSEWLEFQHQYFYGTQ